MGKNYLTIVFDPFESFADGTTVEVDALGKNDSTIVFDPLYFRTVVFTVMQTPNSMLSSMTHHVPFI